MMPVNPAFDMTIDTIGKSLLETFVMQMQHLPDVWQKMAKYQQDEALDAVRKSVESNVTIAVILLAAQERVCVEGTLQAITIKNDTTATVKMSKNSPNLFHLFEGQGKEVLVVLASPEEALKGIDEVKGQDDQRGLVLGHEYHDNDGGGMESEPPLEAVSAQLLKTTKARNGESPNEFGVYCCQPDETVSFNAKNIRIKIDLLDTEKGWVYGLDCNVADEGTGFAMNTNRDFFDNFEEAIYNAQNYLKDIFDLEHPEKGVTAKAWKDFAAFVDKLDSTQRSAPAEVTA